jgi:predicted porin
MKNVSKLALFVAAGMASAGVHAASFEVDDNTTLSLDGEVKLEAKDTEKVNGTSDLSTKAGSEFVLAGERDLGNGFGAYIETTIEYETLDDSDSATEGSSVIGFTGNFGEIQIGQSDNVFEDVVTDATDMFEEADLPKASDSAEDNMFTYYSPDFDGLSYSLQARVTDDSVEDSNSTEVSLIGALEYDLGNVTLGAAYDNRGSKDSDSGTSSFKSEDPLYGLSAVIDISDAIEVAAKYAKQSNASGNDKDFTAVAVAFDYGSGELYGGIGTESPDTGDSITQIGVGVDYDIADDFKVYAEYADEDGQDAADADSIMEVGLELAY